MADAIRRGPTIAPDRITNVDSWIQYSKRYANVVRRSRDGALLVLNPANMDLENPAKEIPLTKAVDAIAYIVQGSDPNIRAQAATRLETVRSERNSAVQSINGTIREKQLALMQAHREWTAAASQGNSAASATIAADIGQLQKELADLDKRRQETRAPHRFIQSRHLNRMAIDYETKDERAISIHCLNLLDTVASDRVVQIATGGAAGALR
jgi:hypothetical protein